MKTVSFKIVMALLLVVSFVYLACNKKELNVPPVTVTELSYFKTESEFRRAAIGAYASIIDYYSAANHGGGSGGTGGSAMFEIWFKPADDISTTNTKGDIWEYFGGLDPSASKLDQAYRSSYIMIGRANKVLVKLHEADPAIFVTPGLREAFEGEMLFLRSFAHYMLWNLFGTAPVDTIVVTSQDQIGLPSSTGNELLEQAITDLTKATAQLPESWPETETGRITKNAALGLLGKILVFKASSEKNPAAYQSAVDAFNQITGLSLTEDFYDNFKEETENNSESLFEFQAGKNISGNGGNTWLANDACDCGTAGTSFQMFYEGNNGGSSNGIWRPTPKLISAFEAGDPRMEVTIDPDPATPRKFIKYVVGGDKNDGSPEISINNFRILRYADVLLLKAEAILKSGGSKSDAIAAINDIRTRARNGGTVPADFSTVETDETTIMQWIMDERLRELAGEGQRWFDLRRWHMAGYITLDNSFFGSLNPGDMEFDTKYLYFPIPLTETSRNVNIVQNPGY